MKNNLDSSSYAKLAAGGKVVSIASYKRNVLEKDLFAFRDKKFFDFDNLAVTSMSYRYEGDGFDFYKKDDRWFMDKPVFSLAQEAKVGEILSAAAMLEAKAFTGAVGTEFRPRIRPGKTAAHAWSSDRRPGQEKSTIGKNGERCLCPGRRV